MPPAADLTIRDAQQQDLPAVGALWNEITAQQGRGVGHALLQAAERRAAGQGIHTLVAAISGENTAAMAFHTRQGFAQTGALPQVGRKQGRWLDLILMTKTLDPH